MAAVVTCSGCGTRLPIEPDETRVMCYACGGHVEAGAAGE